MRTSRIMAAVMAALMLLTAPAMAQEDSETPTPDSFQITTPYPNVAVEAGDDASFDLEVVAPEPTPATLEVEGLPDGWEATFRGGGFEIDGVTAGPTTNSVSLDVTVPADAAEGTYELRATADAGSSSASVDLSIRVSALAGGEVTLTPDVPGLRVPAGEEASFTLELRNDTPSDLDFELSSAGPAGWEVTAEPASEPQATTLQVESGSSTNINVDATSPLFAEAGQYTITVQARAGDTTVEAGMIVEIVGSYSLDLTTPDQRLSAEVSSDGSSEVELVVTNTGTAPIRNIEMDSDPPSGWEVTFDQPVIAELGAGDSIAVVATVTPSEESIAGDYVISFSVDSDLADDEIDIRTTVNPSVIWGLIGVALIALTLAGLAWVFRRFGRR